jgi:hypothetical protein
LKSLKNNALKTALASALLLAGAPLMAQQAATPADPAMPEATTPAAPAAAGSYSDEDLKQFAAAAIEVTKLQSDASVPADQKQPKMLAALQAKGIAPEKFNAIGQAAASDPALQQRIQAAAGAAPAGAAPADPTTPADPAAPAPATPTPPAQ